MSKIIAIFAGLLVVVLTIANFSFIHKLPNIEGAEFRFAETGDCKTLDAAHTSMGLDFRMIRCIYQTLLVVKHGGDGVEPGCAVPGENGKGYTLSDDGLTYTLRIRDDAIWSNGDAVTADDFAFAWMRTCIPDEPGPYFSLLSKIEGVTEFNIWRENQLKAYGESDKKSQEIADAMFTEAYERFLSDTGVDIIDDKSLTITLKQPTAYFPDLLAFPTFSPQHRQSVSAATTTDAETGIALTDPTYYSEGDRLIVNGPYKLDRWDASERMVLTRNPTFWNNDATCNERIVMLVIKDSTLAVRKYMAGEIDYVSNVDNASLAAQIIAKDLCPYELIPSASTWYVRFNCRPEITGVDGVNHFADRRVRRAFALAIDRTPIIEHITRRNDMEAYSFVPPNQIPNYYPPVEDAPEISLHRDIDEARRLLAEYEAEYRETTDPSFKGIGQVEVSLNYGDVNQGIVEVMAHQWEEILGVDITTVVRETNIHYNNHLAKGSFEIGRAGWSGDYMDPTTFLELFESTNSNNDSAYQSEVFDRLLVEADLELDPIKRLEKLRQAEIVLMQDAPFLPIYHSNSLHLYDSSRIDLRQNSWNNLRLELTTIKPTH